MGKLVVQLKGIGEDFPELRIAGALACAAAYILTDDLPPVRVPEVYFSVNPLLETVTFKGSYADLHTLFDELVQAPDVTIRGEVEP